MLITTIYGIVAGILAGLLWGTALGATIATSIKIGAIVGAILGILIALFGKAATAGGNVKQAEATFVNSSILTVIALLAIGAGALAWAFRLIFF